ncbi:MAG: hypothetical protein Q4F66_07930 [Clostridium sp.]|nr:hypothetical protein [Clostridium sp.]
MDNNKCNIKNPKCEFYIPMGRVGSLVIQAPVVLSRLKISIPITSNIDLTDSYENIDTLSNKVFISKPKLKRKNKLSLNGYIEKKIDHKGSCIVTTTIPIYADVPIDFSLIPSYKPSDNECENYYYKKSPSPISFSVDSIEIEEDSYKLVDHSYVNNMIVSIKFTLTQMQYVFIPEPEGDVLLTKSEPLQSQSSTDDFYYTVGYNDCTGLIANKTCLESSSKISENKKD